MDGGNGQVDCMLSDSCVNEAIENISAEGHSTQDLPGTPQSCQDHEKQDDSEKRPTGASEDVMLTHRGTHKESWTSKKGHEVQRASKQSMTRNYKMYRCWSVNCIVTTLPFQRKLFTRGETGS